DVVLGNRVGAPVREGGGAVTPCVNGLRMCKAGSEEARRLHRRSLLTALCPRLSCAGRIRRCEPGCCGCSRRPPAGMATRVFFIDSPLASRRLRTFTRNPCHGSLGRPCFVNRPLIRKLLRAVVDPFTAHPR